MLCRSQRTLEKIFYSSIHPILFAANHYIKPHINDILDIIFAIINLIKESYE